MNPAPWLLLVLCGAVRLFACVVSPVPGRDGVAYLWLAERGLGDGPAGLFTTVFHPLYPALITMVKLLLPGLDMIHAGQLASAAAGALAVLPLWWLTRRLFDQRAANWAGLAYAIGTWFARHPADCMSEGPFYLLAATWALALAVTPRRPNLAGIAAGLAFLARPEGGALLATGLYFLLAAGDRRGARRHAATATVIMLLQPLGSWLSGHGFSLTPKAAFNWDVGAGGASSALGHYLTQWLQLPGNAWEGLGYLVFPLAAAGAVLWRPARRADPRWLLLLPFAVQCLVVPLLKSHHRFVSGFGVLLLPFAGAALAAGLTRLQARHRAWAWLAMLAVFASEAKLYLDEPTDRTIERDLGRWLATQRDPEAVVASDMPRLVYFAGLPPPPPRRIEARDLLMQAAAPTCRFVVLKQGRTALPSDALADLGFERRALPPALRQHPHAERIELHVR